jgi:CDGSH-type Zn-finger protein
MDRLDEAKDLDALVASLYSAGIQLVVSEDEMRVGAVGDVGPVTEEALKANKQRLLEMLTGDPLSGAGWEGRTALYKQALHWLDERSPEQAKERVTAALCRQEVLESLNKAWCDGSFEEFRAALRAYIGTGLRAMKGAA